MEGFSPTAASFAPQSNGSGDSNQVASYQPASMVPGGVRVSPMNHPPTRVLFMRHIPDSVSEQDIVYYCSPFGNVSQIFLIRERQHGFVEFETVDAACVDFAYSGRSQITQKKNADLNPPNRIVLLTITNVQYPVTVDVVKAIFARFGGLDKCIIFARGHAVQVLVQVASTEVAILAKQQLNGQNIYAGCNNIKVQFSSLGELVIKQRSPHQPLDTTLVFPIPEGIPCVGQETSSEDLIQPNNLSMSLDHSFETYNGTTYYTQGLMDEGPQEAALKITGIEENTGYDEMASLVSIYGNVLRVHLSVPSSSSPTSSDPMWAVVVMDSVQQALAAAQHLNALPYRGGRLKVDVVRDGNELGGHVRDFSSVPGFNRHKVGRQLRAFPPSHVLYLSNMPDATDEETIREVRAEIEEGIECRFVDDVHHIAIVTCEDVESAVRAVTLCHNKPFGMPARYLYISFANCFSSSSNPTSNVVMKPSSACGSPSKLHPLSPCSIRDSGSASTSPLAIAHAVAYQGMITPTGDAHSYLQQSFQFPKARPSPDAATSLSEVNDAHHLTTDESEMRGGRQ